MENSEEIIKERSRKLVEFFKKNQSLWIYLLLAVIIIFGGIWLRTLNVSQLKDVTTNTWTLAPDLDPFLFLRWAKEIAANGSLSAIDNMRYVPLGYNTANEMVLLSQLIVYLYQFMHIFSSQVTVEYAAIIYPVICFCLSLIAFFLFVSKAFSGYKNSKIIALISTAFISVIPGFVHRTVAGVPEKEPGGILFMFLALYFMACALKEEKLKKSALFGLLAGISTALMGLLWGGVTFLFVTIAFATMLLFFFSDFKKKDVIAYALWVIGFTVILITFPRYGMRLFTSSTSGIAYFVLGLLITDIILFGTKLKEKLKLDRIKIPEKIISLITLTLIGLVFILILEPGFIGHILNDLSNYIIKPFATDRFTLTVAENSRPFFDSWKGSFGLSFFWIFILGSIFFVYELFSKLKVKDRLTLTGLYAFMIIGMIFSRYSSASVLNGESWQSLTLFLGSIALFFFVLVKTYLKEKEINLDQNMVLIFAVLFFAIFSARASIRLFYFIYPIAPILAAFLIVRTSEMAFEIKEDVEKIALFIFAGIIIVLSIMALYQFYNQAVSEVKYATVPGHYQIQWQEAMSWVREETPKDAVFAHWWDYGYWVQTIGERATVLDGGNLMTYWDHLMGRHVLTGTSEKEALEFLKTHKATYLLIDSSDIGKYPAYSSIGADENYDRYSWISSFSLGDTQEKRNETVYVFTGGTMLDDDIVWKGKIYPKGEAGIAAIILSVEKTAINNLSVEKIAQPNAVLVYQNKQIQVPINCIYLQGKKIEFEEGIDGCFYMIPVLSNNQLSQLGSGLWLSPKLMDSLMVKLYILNETKNFELVHSEQDPIIDQLNSQYKLDLPDLTVYGSAGLLGPIKIWKINYPEDIEENPAYLETDYPDKALSEVKR